MTAMSRATALSTVIQAAESWSRELGEYIIPASEAADDGADYSEGKTKLDQAIEVLSAKPTPDPDGLPQEFLDKRQSLAMFLLAMATHLTWEDAEGVDYFHENYTKDADEVLRSQPHLLGLETREAMGIE